MNELSAFEASLLREHFPDEAGFEGAKGRVLSGEPLAYVIGEWYFRNETYKLSADCLIPRPDTEHLVDVLVQRLPRGGRFLDLCTGSGCIAISTLCERPDLTAQAVDVSRGAVEMAKVNAKENGVSRRIDFVCGDVFIGQGRMGEFDAIVSNPPYIQSSVVPTLSEQVRHEPVLALDGGQDGMVFYRAILGQYRNRLKAGGIFVFEIGYDLADAMRELCARVGMGCEVKKDYGGNDRVAVVFEK